MDLPDESQWDETTCGSAVCQHPQCWATIRRVERGHPRILSSPCRTPQDAEDKLPVLTVVNIPDSCFAPRRLPECTFTKTRSLLSQSSKFDSKFQGRPPRGLPDKSLINCANRLPKLPVLNLNETQLPCLERNMVVLWIPEETEIHVSQYGKKKKNLAVSWDLERKRGGPHHSEEKSKSFLGLSENQSTETRVGTPEMIVPPPTPVQLSEKFRSDFLPLWAQSEAIPQDLLKELFPGRKQTMPCREMKIQLAMMRKNLSLKVNRPDSAISSKMFLSIHRLTLERPALRYPEHLKKLHNLKTEGPELYETEPTNKDISTLVEAVPEAQAVSQKKVSLSFSESMARTSWNPELKLLRILQDTDDEDEESQSSETE
ncbi:uncharacterized protein C9orf43 homolog isoform X5 [Callithrix jacchus]